MGHRLLQQDKNIELDEKQLDTKHNLHKASYLGRDLGIDFQNRLDFQDIVGWLGNL